MRYPEMKYDYSFNPPSNPPTPHTLLPQKLNQTKTAYIGHQRFTNVKNFQLSTVT